MNIIPFFQVDAFTSKVFGGNPAAVCLLDQWLDNETLQSIAAENNLSETAFVVEKASSHFELKWFTPSVEIDLCGHATLATAFILFRYFCPDSNRLDFDTLSGRLFVEKKSDLITMNFPARAPHTTNAPENLVEALGATPDEVLRARDLLVLFKDEEAIRSIKPDFAKLKTIKDSFAVIITAPGGEADFVSRFFAPKAGIDEDPVTGSAHCTLTPFWAKRLGRNKLKGQQLSCRGGELYCELLGDRVLISGNCALFAKGEILL